MYYSYYVKCGFINECQNANSNLCMICVHNKIKKEYDYLQTKNKFTELMDGKK